MQVTTSYRTLAGPGVGEVERSRSRFRCRVVRVEDEEGARAVLEQARREQFDAHHHCSAYVVGPAAAIEGSSDAGEPPGTAGLPMLDTLRGRELSDVVAVTSRWFGGSTLGTGGLARAYVEVLVAALDDAGTLERVRQQLCEVEVDIAAVGRLEHGLRSRGAHLLGVEYTGEATLRFAVPPRALAVAEELVEELTEGAASLRVVGEQWVDAPLA